MAHNDFLFFSHFTIIKPKKVLDGAKELRKKKREKLLIPYNFDPDTENRRKTTVDRSSRCERLCKNTSKAIGRSVTFDIQGVLVPFSFSFSKLPQ